MSDEFRVISEGEIATEASWIERFGGDVRIFSELLSDGILKNTGFSSGRRNFALNFVGLLVVGSSAWFSFPKASKARSWSDAIIVLKTIIEYRKKFLRSQTVVDFGSTADRLSSGTLVDAFTALVLWTVNRGFHHEFVEDSKSIHEGIDWGRTISSTPAMHSNASVVYPSPVTRIQSHKLSGLAELQAYALLEMRSRLGVFASIVAPDDEEIWERCAEIVEDGNVDTHPATVSSTIEVYASSTNRDEDLELIALLQDWFEATWSSGIRLSAYGISAFHTVWEDICKQATSSLGEPIPHVEIASQPTYIIGDQQLTLTPQRPDILLKRAGSVLLADAKWYLLDEKVLPQTPDAIKQFAYGLSINADVRMGANLLLLPTEAEVVWELAGTLYMTHAGNKDKRFQSILVIGLNWIYLAQLYVDRQCLPEDFISEINMKIRL